ncbi:HopJ type III effector protein [Marinobacter sp. CHS3-4]|uniref:HopJ type III effector protein n=1 Tax=Marinobacter sp. CHS3-4 TaxID=3045174 RepID=UPI0024B5C4F4|nr:HopJ type III effector protein [Marinobacter sp. CHS3-4]MDI9246165.1 HopJ type III effector protein [Marinobacter sp. CHS3-4]
MNVNERVRIHLASIDAGHGHFKDTLELISAAFDYEPAGFHNGPLFNAAGENEGSCRVFSLAQYCNLNESDTLRLFAEHYQNVLDDPAGDSHGNIRQFMTTGWSGIRFEQPPLRKRPATGPGDNTEESL